MTTTKGDSSYTYCTAGKTPKSVNVLSEVVCSHTVDSPKDEREKFIQILERYLVEDEIL